MALAALSLGSSRAGPDPTDPGVPASSVVVGGAASGAASGVAVPVNCVSVLRRYGRSESGYVSGMQAHPTCDHRGKTVLYYDYLGRMGIR